MVEVRAHTEGGDGAVAQIQITGNKLQLFHFTVVYMSLGENTSQSLGIITFIGQIDESV